MKKTYWLREFACLLRGEHADVGQAMEVLQHDGHLTVHLVTQLLRMFLISEIISKLFRPLKEL